MSQSEALDRIRQVRDRSDFRGCVHGSPHSWAIASHTRAIGSAKNGQPRTVSSAERQAAMHSFMLLTQSKPREKTNLDTSPKSPAEALLSTTDSTIDRVEIFEDAIAVAESLPTNNERTPLNDFQPLNASSANPFQPPAWNSTWQQWSGGDLARMLMNERPNVIAALILQCPNELAASILEALPSQTACDVLAALPQLASTDPYLLQEIYDVLHTRLIDFQRQSSPTNAGLTKLQAIMANLSHEHQNRIRNDLRQSQPMLAHSLGLDLKPSQAKAAGSIKVEENVAAVPSQAMNDPTPAEASQEDIC